MKDELRTVLDEEFETVQPSSLEDIYFDDSDISLLVQEQNIQIRKNRILEILHDLRNNGVDIEFQDSMSLEELEQILNQVRV